MVRVLFAYCMLLPALALAAVPSSRVEARKAKPVRKKVRGKPSPPAAEPGQAGAEPMDAGVAAPVEAPVDPITKMDELYRKRADPAAAKELAEMLAEATKQHPDDVEVLWRQARFNVWNADALGPGEAKKNIGKATWALGDKVMKAAPQKAEGHYYGALGVGQYSQGVGILNALAEGLEGKFNERLDKAIQLNPSIDNGGPLMTKGRYFFELPWPLKNLGKSAEWFSKCIAKHPENLRCHAWLGETLLRDGKAKAAKVEVDQALSGDSSYNPAEASRVKGLAKVIAAEVAKELK